MATLAQTKGDVKDVQAILSHSKADTTVNDYMQQIEAGVKQTLDGIYSELTDPKSPQLVKNFGNLVRFWYARAFLDGFASGRIQRIGA